MDSLVGRLVGADVGGREDLDGIGLGGTVLLIEANACSGFPSIRILFLPDTGSGRLGRLVGAASVGPCEGLGEGFVVLVGSVGDRFNGGATVGSLSAPSVSDVAISIGIVMDVNSESSVDRSVIIKVVFPDPFAITTFDPVSSNPVNSNSPAEAK